MMMRASQEDSMRRVTQKRISFPAQPNEIDRSMLATVNNDVTDEDSREEFKSYPPVKTDRRGFEEAFASSLREQEETK